MKIVNQRIIEQVKGLKLPDGEYAVFGSALLEVLGLRESGDIDILMTRRLFESLGSDWERFKYPNGDDGIRRGGEKAVEAFYYCNFLKMSEEVVEDMIVKAVDLGGVKFVSLDATAKWKNQFGRDKDLRDVKLIKKYLEEK